VHFIQAIRNYLLLNDWVPPNGGAREIQHCRFSAVQRERKLTPEAEEKPEVQKWRLPCSFYHSSTVVL